MAANLIAHYWEGRTPPQRLRKYIARTKHPNKHQISTGNLEIEDGPSLCFLPLVRLLGAYGV